MSLKIKLVRSPRSLHGSLHGFRTQRIVLPSNCFLCLLLWPTMLQHRHVPDSSGSEAETILCTKASRDSYDNAAKRLSY
jgi:hypothetical protein